MKLVHKLFSESILIDRNNEITRIIIEDKSTFHHFIHELITQCEINDGEFIMSKNSDILDFSKNATVIYDYFNFDTEKKLVNILISHLNQKAQDNFFEDVHLIKATIQQLTSKLIVDENDSLYMSDFEFIDVLKMMKPYLMIDREKLEDSILEYILILSEYGGIKVFFIVNSSAYLNEKCANDLMKNLKNHGLSAVLVENNIEYSLEYVSNTVIIDDDLCEIK